MSATTRRDISGYERAVSALAGYVAGSMVATWQIPVPNEGQDQSQPSHTRNQTNIRVTLGENSWGHTLVERSLWAQNSVIILQSKVVPFDRVKTLMQARPRVLALSR